MREDITTIPITDVFEPRDGCPLCRMRDMLEERSTVYITGAAMMEPDVRIKTNESGFCRRHFGMMVSCGTRLSNALILQSHLDKIKTELIPKDVKGKPSGEEADDDLLLLRSGKLGHGAYVPDNIQQLYE